MKFLTVVLIAAAIVGAAWAWFFAPYYIDAWKMQDVTGSAAASWAAFTEEKGRAKLHDELKRREIPDYLTEDKCTFYEDVGEVKVVDCDWYVAVYTPLVEPRRLKFRVVRAVGRGGRLAER